MNDFDKIILVGIGIACIELAITGRTQNVEQFFKVFMNPHKVYKIKDEELYFGC